MEDFIGNLEDEYLATLLQTYYHLREDEYSGKDARINDFIDKYGEYLKNNKISVKIENKTGSKKTDKKVEYKVMRQQLIEEAAIRFVRSKVNKKTET